MKIWLKHEPENKTKFNPGDVLGYEKSPTKFMVVGEDDLYLHTFVLGTGQYWGIAKLINSGDNIKCLDRHSVGDIDE
jgi:hypothetical protein